MFKYGFKHHETTVSVVCRGVFPSVVSSAFAKLMDC